MCVSLRVREGSCLLLALQRKGDIPHKSGDFSYNRIYPACKSAITFLSFCRLFSLFLANWSMAFFFSSPNGMLAYFQCGGEQGHGVHAMREQYLSGNNEEISFSFCTEWWNSLEKWRVGELVALERCCQAPQWLPFQRLLSASSEICVLRSPSFDAASSVCHVSITKCALDHD